MAVMNKYKVKIVYEVEGEFNGGDFPPALVKEIIKKLANHEIDTWSEHDLFNADWTVKEIDVTEK